MRSPEPKSRLTAVLSDPHRAALERVGAYFSTSGAEGWIEYWFWDVVEGRRPWIFWLDADDGIRADMLALRDEARVWFTWSFTRRVWEPVRLAVWREHAAKHGFDEAQNRCADFQKKTRPRGPEDKKQ